MIHAISGIICHIPLRNVIDDGVFGAVDGDGFFGAQAAHSEEDRQTETVHSFPSQTHVVTQYCLG